MRHYFLLLILCIILSFMVGCKSKEGDTSKVTGYGTIERIDSFNSKFVRSRNIDVWLPKDYNSNEKYAVLYMHDGQMLYDSTTTWNKQEWGVDEVMTSLIDQGKIRKTIVVGIWNTTDRHAEYFPQKPFESLTKEFRDSMILLAKQNATTPQFLTYGESDKYLEFIVKELKPFIDSTYSTYPDKGNTSIMGSSMGGLISMYAICEYPEVFGDAACLSTHWTGTFTAENNPIPSAFMDYLNQNVPDQESHRIYFDYGTETLDALYEPFQLQADSIMIKKGYSESNWKTLKFVGANHSERAWNKRLHIPLQFLLGIEKG